jgi:uncharacterized membrane protein YtjA (UPF0391 family)
MRYGQSADAALSCMRYNLASEVFLRNRNNPFAASPTRTSPLSYTAVRAWPTSSTRQPRQHFTQIEAEHGAPRPERAKMLHYAVVFFIIALIAAVFGFGGIAAGAVGIAKVLFFVFLILAAVSLIANMARRT